MTRRIAVISSISVSSIMPSPQGEEAEADLRRAGPRARDPGAQGPRGRGHFV